MGNSWNQVPLGEIVPASGIQTGPFGSQLHASDYVEDGVPVVMPRDMINQRISDKGIDRITPEMVRSLARHKLEVGDIVFARRGEMGRCALVTSKEEGWLCGTGSLRVRLDRAKAHPEFVIQYLALPDPITWLESNAVGQTMLNLSATVLSELPVLLPPLGEQRKIAAILGTWDAAIATVEQLIAALQTRKQGLMQRLLTGAVRFPEFAECEWEDIRLGDTVRLVNGRAFKPNDWQAGGLPIIRIQNLNGSEDYNYYDDAVEPRYYVETGDLLFSWSGSRGTSFGPHIWNGPRGILNQHIFRVDTAVAMNRNYLYYALQHITQAIEQRAHGSAGLVHVTKGELESFYVPIPTIKEQQCIASVLDAVEDNVRLYSAYRNGLTQQKQALMQQLLTGQVRVNVGEEAQIYDSVHGYGNAVHPANEDYPHAVR